MRFKLDPTIRFDGKELEQIYKLKKPSRIFMCSTHEIFGNWIPDEWRLKIFQAAEDNPQHTFLFLSKIPLRYVLYRISHNCWVGMTMAGKESFEYNFHPAVPNKKFISFEPLNDIPYIWKIDESIKHIIIGAQTQPYKAPKEEWIELILDTADRYNIPVFMKDNLKTIWRHKLIQELPE